MRNFVNSKTSGILLACLALVIPMLIEIEGLSSPGRLALGIFLMASILWVTETIPIWSTSLLVIFFQVLLLSDQSLILNATNIGNYAPHNYQDFYANLAHPIIILFLSGFFLASAAVKFGLDKNLTRFMLNLFGTKPENVILGLMLTTALLSAFMSNTATSAMMITVVLPIIARLEPGDPLKLSLALSIPCGANIGGVATPIGSPPNALVLGALAKQEILIGFAQWMLIGVPLVVIMIFITWKMIMRLFPPQCKTLEVEVQGGWNTSPQAILTYIIFGVTILLWITDSFHGVPATVVAFLPIALLSLSGIISKGDLKKFSWDVLWLVAGGLSLGMTMNFEMGPAPWIISLINWNALNPTIIVLGLGATAYILSNLISNTVAASILVPIAITMGISNTTGSEFNFAQAGVFIGIMVSFSMLLPISTPPNAIAMSTGLLETHHLVRIGIRVGLFGFMVTSIFALFLWRWIIPSLF